MENIPILQYSGHDYGQGCCASLVNGSSRLFTTKAQSRHGELQKSAADFKLRHYRLGYSFCRAFRIFTNDPDRSSSCVRLERCSASSSVSAPQLTARRK